MEKHSDTNNNNNNACVFLIFCFLCEYISM